MPSMSEKIGVWGERSREEEINVWGGLNAQDFSLCLFVFALFRTRVLVIRFRRQELGGKLREAIVICTST